LRRTLSSSP